MTPENTRIERLARSRARAKLGWYSHLAIYLVVNLALVALSLANGRHWAIFPVLGWGVGLLFHGLSVWLFQPGGELMARMVDRERARLGSAPPERGRLVNARGLVRRLALALPLLGALAQGAGAATGVTVLPAPAETGPVTVFYPTAATPARYVRGAFSFQLAADAAPERGNGRLVVMSHGSGGSPWPQADLAIALTAAGFTVAMPEHKGDNWRDMRDVGPVTWRQRPREVSKAIDAMAADPRFATALDLRRVGVYGMSAGGLTALTLAGAQWSPALLAKHCNAHLADDFPACVGLATELTGGPMDALRLGIARRVIEAKLGSQTTLEGWTDPRIVAAVSAVPMAALVDLPSVAAPRIPLGFVRAGQDGWLAPRWHLDAVRDACRTCVMVADMPTAGHGSILSPQPPDLPPRAAKLLDDPPGFDRAEIPGVYAAIGRFFVQNLAP